MKQSHEKTGKHESKSSGSTKKVADHYGSDDKSLGKKLSEKGSQSTKMSHRASDNADSE